MNGRKKTQGYCKNYGKKTGSGAVNDLRNKLLQLYRYYSSKQKNPMQAWSEMEAKAFWDMFGDYEDAGGNGHMKTEVKPAMRRLEEIPMTETEKIKELMESRQ